MANRITVYKTGRAEPVYDLINCGPRHRFAVWDKERVRIVSNCVQAIARDCLAVTLLRLEDRGYNTVLHIHDECVIEAPEGAELQPVLDVMAEPVPWAPGLILRGAGFATDQYYMKD